MARNRLRGRSGALSRLFGLALGVVTWGLAAAALPGVVGDDFGEAARRLEERIERQIEHAPPPDPAPAVPTPSESDPFEPWELVRV